MKSALLLCSLLCSAIAAQSPDTCRDDEVSLLQTVSDVRKHNAVSEQNQAAEAKDLKATLKQISDKEGKWENNIKLSIVLKRATGLADRDSLGFGASDPFCEVKLAVCAGCEGTKDKSMKKSPVVNNNNNPTWNWKYLTTDWSSGDRVAFTCYDYDTIGKNDLLGTAMLDLKRGENTKDRAVELQKKGVLYLDVSWERCSGDCDDMVTTMAKIANNVYEFNPQVGNYHMVLQDNVAPSNPEFGEDHMALYKKKGSSTDCVLAFSGSNDNADWSQNLAVDAAKNVCGIKKIHQGFLSEVSNYFKSEGMVLFSQVIKSICGGKVISVGHSLGGAVATIAAGCLNSPGGVKAIPQAHKDVTSFTASALYTIGAPAVSSPQITDAGGKCFQGRRAYNYDSRTYDIVPEIASKLGYVHPKVEALEMFSNDNGALTLRPYRCFTPQAQSYPYNHTLAKLTRVPSVPDHKAVTYINRARVLLR